jgi:dipeptidyl aminopeptidase/acylaminoacyl peptidase
MNLIEINEIFKVSKVSVNHKFFSARVQSIFKSIWDAVIFYEIIYYSNGKKIKGFIVEPKLGINLPVIIYNRGGSKEYGKIEENQLFLLLAEMASWGYVIIATQYSGNDGSEGKDEYGGEEVEDILNLKPIIDTYEKVDSNNIGMFGGSRGGMMAFLVLKQIDWLNTLVILSGSTNTLRNYALRPDVKDFRSDMYDVNSEQENMKRSPLLWADTISKNTPILLFHGTNDDQVSPLDTLEMGVELYKNNIPFELHMYIYDDHKLSKNRTEVMDKTKNWFDKHLKMKTTCD